MRGRPRCRRLGANLPHFMRRGSAMRVDNYNEPPPAALSGRGALGARPDRGSLLPQHGAPHRPRARVVGSEGRRHDPVPGGAAAVLAAPALAPSSRAARGRLAALRGLHDVRDRLSRALHLHRRGRAPEPRDRKGAQTLRHRSREVRVLRLLRGGVSRGRDSHGHGDPGVLLLQPRWNDLHEGDAAVARARPRRRPPAFTRPAAGEPETLMAHVAFFIVAALAIGSALGLILRKNAIHGALFLVVNLGAIAALYLMLGAEFLAAAQVIVYAGAIMVLFVFAIMVLIPGKEESGPDPRRGARLLAVPVGALLGLLLAFVVAGRWAGPPGPGP